MRESITKSIPAVTAHFRGQLPDAFPEGMIVFFVNSGQFFPAFNPFMIIAVAQLFTRHAGWETGQRTLRSLNQVGAGVRPGGRLIQLDKNGPPQLRLDNSRIHVTADEWSIVPAVIGGKMLFSVGIAPESRRGERRHTTETVLSTLQTHILSHRAPTRGWGTGCH